MATIISKIPVFIFVSVSVLSPLAFVPAYAADPPKQAPSRNALQENPSDAPGGQGLGGAEQVNVESIKNKYWARGDESELGVVQNRLYSKEKKLSVSLFGGVIATDPFLSVQNLGGSVGFHFNEYLGLHFIGWKDYVSPSGALQTFRDKTGGDVSVNWPQSFYGAEVSASVLYGKLSLVGKQIIYFDLHAIAGGGVTNTESGNYATPYLGVGQQVYLAQFLALRIDYRLMAFREHILEKVVPSQLGSDKGSRTNFTNSITLGIEFLFGLFK